MFSTKSLKGLRAKKETYQKKPRESRKFLKLIDMKNRGLSS